MRDKEQAPQVINNRAPKRSTCNIEQFGLRSRFCLFVYLTHFLDVNVLETPRFTLSFSMSNGPVLLVPFMNLMLDLELTCLLYVEKFPIIPQAPAWSSSGLLCCHNSNVAQPLVTQSEEVPFQRCCWAFCGSMCTTPCYIQRREVGWEHYSQFTALVTSRACPGLHCSHKVQGGTTSLPLLYFAKVKPMSKLKWVS